MLINTQTRTVELTKEESLYDVKRTLNNPMFGDGSGWKIVQKNRIEQNKKLYLALRYINFVLKISVLSPFKKISSRQYRVAIMCVNKLGDMLKEVVKNENSNT